MVFILWVVIPGMVPGVRVVAITHSTLTLLHEGLLREVCQTGHASPNSSGGATKRPASDDCPDVGSTVCGRLRFLLSFWESINCFIFFALETVKGAKFDFNSKVK